MLPKDSSPIKTISNKKSIITISKKIEISKTRYCSAYKGWEVYAPLKDKADSSRHTSKDHIVRNLLEIWSSLSEEMHHIVLKQDFYLQITTLFRVTCLNCYHSR